MSEREKVKKRKKRRPTAPIGRRHRASSPRGLWVFFDRSFDSEGAKQLSQDLQRSFEGSDTEREATEEPVWRRSGGSDRDKAQCLNSFASCFFFFFLLFLPLPSGPAAARARRGRGARRAADGRARPWRVVGGKREEQREGKLVFFSLSLAPWSSGGEEKRVKRCCFFVSPFSLSSRACFAYLIAAETERDSSRQRSFLFFFFAHERDPQRDLIFQNFLQVSFRFFSRKKKKPKLFVDAFSLRVFRRRGGTK